MSSTTIKGLGDLKKNMQALPKNLVTKTLKAALRQGANIIADRARSNVPEMTGALRSSIRVTPRRGTPDMVVFNVVAGDLTKAKAKKFGIESAFYAVMVERGHHIRGKGQRLRGGSRSKFQQRAALVEKGAPMVPPHPFMRPALEQGASGAIDAIADVVRNRLAEVAK